MPIKTESHFQDFQRFLARAVPETLDEIGDMVDATIEAEAPKRSGTLAAAGRHEVRGRTLYFINDATNERGDCYAAFVHLGTYKMNANPWMLRGISKDSTRIAEKLVEGLQP